MSYYQPFLISVGEAGAYSDTMQYQKPFDTRESFGLWIKHAPYNMLPKLKDMVTQTWKDEQGDDVYLPPSGPMFEAYDCDIEFVYYDHDGMANESIQAFIERIKGKWLKIYDSYTRIGRQAVFLSEFGSTPQFTRRGTHDTVILKVKFRVNDPRTNIILK